MSDLNFIDISGIGNSGKSAVNQILSEVEGVWSPHHFFEFDLFRVRGGLLDLRHAFKEDWSQVRSHSAYKEFQTVVTQLCLNPKPWNIYGHLISTSQKYERHFGSNLIPAAEEFLDSFITNSYEAEWPFDRLRYSSLKNFSYKVAHKLGLRRFLMQKVLMIDGQNFDEKATHFISSIYKDMIPNDKSIVIFNNGFEPFNPVPGLNMLQNSKQIVVLRDPRDIYISGLNFHNINDEDKGLLPQDNDGLNKSFLATDDINLFIDRFELFSNHIYSRDDQRIFKLYFEDLVTNYDETVLRILNFLDLDPSLHKNRKKVFDPSKASYKLWLDYSKKDEISYIEKRLSKYLYRGQVET